MRVGVICEGTTDVPLLRALLCRIAEERADLSWVDVEDAVTPILLRKRGHGGVVQRVLSLIALLSDAEPPNYDLIVVLLDRRTREAQQRIKRAMARSNLFTLGIAIEEIEAWWLADRSAVLDWLGLCEADVRGTEYDAGTYQPERDQNPKRTLSRLTDASEVCTSHYGDGHTGMAIEFAETWSARARLDVIEAACSRGFRPFCRRTTDALRRARTASGRLF